MKTVRIIGVDPGKATGFAVVDLVRAPKLPPDPLLRQFRFSVHSACTFQLEGHAKVIRTLVQTYATAPYDLVVANEKYVVTRLTQQSQDTQSLEVTGSLKAILAVLDVPHTYCEQLPSSAKMLMTDARLAEMLPMINLRRLDDHARDALRHACTWAVAWVQNKTQLTHHVES